ncbi:hypothetical protein [Elizabethkingia anophelis]|uniref:hypothetical protein n=1 Tax=Elizabethkingia anophelis TaxID=1117645 RepID=UPI0011EAFFAD|nr:hypothetical protein [Elizabethkingia anophelis]MCT3721342.1 hypothetical protein [Elizabethkingia anophelis]MCT3724853.1 hypothetical protein [Elizabethkingia anophelis]MDV4116857.1 hypothetical protein [Elizabethkingia anophelis]TYT28335.1 hypothetical protein FZC31_12235 [Elizabethkingia anophelis]UKY88912.1 hypothetical protein KUF64_11480 [Elizabethkingia anophelis]
MKSKIDLKNYFQNGSIPNQEQYRAWIDSYWHKNEYIDASQIHYTNATPTSRPIGGIAEGTTFYKKSVLEILDMILYDSKIYPDYTFGLEVHATPEDAKVVMNGTVTNSINAVAGTSVVYTITKPGYINYEGRALIDRELSLDVILEEE